MERRWLKGMDWEKFLGVFVGFFPAIKRIIATWFYIANHETWNFFGRFLPGVGFFFFFFFFPYLVVVILICFLFFRDIFLERQFRRFPNLRVITESLVRFLLNRA